MLCKNNLIQHIEDLINYKITHDEYYELSERCYSEYGDLLKKCYPDFNQKFMEVVPEACLYYIDEPELDDNSREIFRNIINNLYKTLIEL